MCFKLIYNCEPKPNFQIKYNLPKLLSFPIRQGLGMKSLSATGLWCQFLLPRPLGQQPVVLGGSVLPFFFFHCGLGAAP